MNLIIMGAPGAGKGTHSEKLSKRWNIPAISTGEILRGAIKKDTELGKKARPYVESGRLVPDELVIAIAGDYLSSDECKNGFILDGFPRSIPQAQALDDMGVRIDAVLNLETDEDVIIERMSGRRLCSGCGATYNLKSNPPKIQSVCDRCSSPLSVREDDAPDTVRKRLEIYRLQTEPLKGYYAGKGRLVTVDSNGTVDEVDERILRALDSFLGY